MGKICDGEELEDSCNDTERAAGKARLTESSDEAVVFISFFLSTVREIMMIMMEYMRA